MADNTKVTGEFFDLQRALFDKSSTFGDEVKTEIDKLIAFDNAHQYKSAKEQINVILKLCHNNPSELLPFVFPNFNRGKAMCLQARPHAYSMLAYIPNGSLTVQASRQIGKCCSGDTEVHVRAGKNGEKHPTTLEQIFNSAPEKSVVSSDLI